MTSLKKTRSIIVSEDTSEGGKIITYILYENVYFRAKRRNMFSS